MTPLFNNDNNHNDDDDDDDDDDDHNNNNNNNTLDSNNSTLDLQMSVLTACPCATDSHFESYLSSWLADGGILSTSDPLPPKQSF